MPFQFYPSCLDILKSSIDFIWYIFKINFIITRLLSTENLIPIIIWSTRISLSDLISLHHLNELQLKFLVHYYYGALSPKFLVHYYYGALSLKFLVHYYYGALSLKLLMHYYYGALSLKLLMHYYNGALPRT